MKTKTLSADAKAELLAILQKRFENHPQRHEGLKWEEVRSRLENSDKLLSLSEMERTGGEPDVIGHDAKTGRFLFVDCSPESPSERRSLCYDRAALDARKQNKPSGSAMDLARTIGIEILDEDDYRNLQRLGPFDLKTSSWIVTPDAIRKKGGALFCDRRYDAVFTYHNGADSYYAARGFRGKLYV